VRGTCFVWGPAFLLGPGLPQPCGGVWQCRQGSRRPGGVGGAIDPSASLLMTFAPRRRFDLPCCNRSRPPQTRRPPRRAGSGPTSAAAAPRCRPRAWRCSQRRSAPRPSRRWPRQRGSGERPLWGRQLLPWLGGWISSDWRPPSWLFDRWFLFR
jgi:hypothetical protein